MMPVVRLNDATFVDLRTVAAWLGTTTPAETVDQLVKEKMLTLDLERDVEEHGVVDDETDGPIVFEKASGLTFTRILSVSINGEKIGKTNWAGLLTTVIGRVKAQGFAGEKLVSELEIPARVSVYEDEGYRYHAEIGISFQGQPAADAWKEVSRLAEKHRIPVEVNFQWRNNEKAQHPGRVGIIRAGA